jgi:hypothetical protein
MQLIQALKLRCSAISRTGLLVGIMLNQESVLMVGYLALGQNNSSNKVIRFQALKHGLEV